MLAHDPSSKVDYAYELQAVQHIFPGFQKTEVVISSISKKKNI